MKRLGSLLKRVQTYADPPPVPELTPLIQSNTKADGMLFVEEASASSKSEDCPSCHNTGVTMTLPIILNPSNINPIDQPLYQEQHRRVDHMLTDKKLSIVQDVLDKGHQTVQLAGDIHQAVIDFTDTHKNQPLVPPHILLDVTPPDDTPPDNQRKVQPDVLPVAVKPQLVITIPEVEYAPTPPGVDPVVHRRSQRRLKEQIKAEEEQRLNDIAEAAKVERESGADYVNVKIRVPWKNPREDNQRTKQREEFVLETVRRKVGGGQ